MWRSDDWIARWLAMTSRIIRHSALTSRSLDQLSDGAERLWWRLTLVADDHGRFDADPRIVLAGCFPLRSGEMALDTIAGWLDELEQAGGIVRYEVESHMYGQFVKWAEYQRPPRYKSRYPDPKSGYERAVADNSGLGSRVLGIGSGVLGIGYGGRPPIAARSREQPLSTGPSEDLLHPDQNTPQDERSCPAPKSLGEMLADLRKRAEGKTQEPSG
jgi:hypothetical protein